MSAPADIAPVTDGGCTQINFHRRAIDLGTVVQPCSFGLGIHGVDRPEDPNFPTPICPVRAFDIAISIVFGNAVRNDCFTIRIQMNGDVVGNLSTGIDAIEMAVQSLRECR